MKPLVSVIIPTYNRARFLKEALASVLAQTYRPLEIIVVDDGSTDETSKVVSRFPVRYVRTPHRGVAAARNRGLSKARGALIAFLDSDDLWLPRKIEVQVSFFERQPEAVAVQTEEVWLRGGKRVNPKKRHRKPSGHFFDRALELCLISPSAVMLRREVLEEIGGFDETFPVCEDYELWLRLLARYPVYLIPEPLVIKRGGHPDQLSKTPGLDWYRLKALAKIYRQPHLSPAMRLLVLKEALFKAAVYAKGARRRGKWWEVYEIEKTLAEILSSPGLVPTKALSK